MRWRAADLAGRRGAGARRARLSDPRRHGLGPGPARVAPPDARELTPEEKQRLAGFFTPEILDVARVKAVRAIDNPDFFSVYEDAGLPLPLDLSGASGLALLDTILVVQSPRPLGSPAASPRKGANGINPLLFHELVHVVQDRVLGERYLELYVRSWAEGGRRYRAITHEDQAFELQNRFRAKPSETFLVEDEVRRRFAAHLADGTE